ncbi:MAG: hypothetical protein ACRC5A_12360 [Enterobacteriaceae bacterium]
MNPVCLRKKPSDVLDYDVDFSRWLPEGDTILTAEVTARGIKVESVLTETPVVKVWLSGGEPVRSYPVTVTVLTQQGRKKSVCFMLRITACRKSRHDHFTEK